MGKTSDGSPLVRKCFYHREKTWDRPLWADVSPPVVLRRPDAPLWSRGEVLRRGRLRKNDSREPRRSTLVHRHRTTTTPAQPYTSEQRRRLAASLSSIATRTLCATKTTETPASTPARPPTHLRSTGGRSKRFQRENDRWPRSARSDATPSASS